MVKRLCICTIFRRGRHRNQTYPVTVIYGTTNKPNAEPGETVTITANIPPSGQAFDRWTSTDGIIFEKATSATTFFTMPAKMVTVTANYKELLNGEHSITVQTDWHGTAIANVNSAMAGTLITITVNANNGYIFKEWDVISDNVTITDNTFTMPDENVVLIAHFQSSGEIKYISQQETFAAWTNNGILHISGLKQGEKWEVYTVSGTKVYEGIAIGTKHVFPVKQKGFYYQARKQSS